MVSPLPDISLWLNSLVIYLRAIASNWHGRMKMNQFIIEHLDLLRVVVAICDISMELLRLVTLNGIFLTLSWGHRVGF